MSDTNAELTKPAASLARHTLDGHERPDSRPAQPTDTSRLPLTENLPGVSVKVDQRRGLERNEARRRRPDTLSTIAIVTRRRGCRRVISA